MTDPIEHLEFDTTDLMSKYPPVWRNPNKQAVFDVACRPDDSPRGQLGYSRWAATAPPDRVDPKAAADLVIARGGYFDYEAALEPADAVEWHVNFADPNLFFGYGSALFAQDEMQVAEHPALGALREALVAAGHDALTAERGQPTPVLVSGVERRCRIATDPNSAEGRPHGLYGNDFSQANADAVARATTRIEPPTITNLIAIAAPAGGWGRYRLEEINLALTTAFTGFRAAVLESQRLGAPAARVAIHTGYWGCGAFGGNRVLMAMLQALAAQMAGADRLVFHTGSTGGGEPLDEALRMLRDRSGPGSAPTTTKVVAWIDALAFEWGISDGN